MPDGNWSEETELESFRLAARPTIAGVASAAQDLFYALHDHPDVVPTEINEAGEVEPMVPEEDATGALPKAGLLEESFRVLQTNEISFFMLHRLGALATDWHAAQPLEAAELELVRTAVTRFPRRWVEAPLQLARIEEIPEQLIIARGVRSVTSGPAIIERWKTWHDQAGPYANQHTLSPARTALLSLIRWALELQDLDEEMAVEESNVEENDAGIVDHPAWHHNAI